MLPLQGPVLTLLLLLLLLLLPLPLLLRWWRRLRRCGSGVDHLHSPASSVTPLLPPPTLLTRPGPPLVAADSWSLPVLPWRPPVEDAAAARWWVSVHVPSVLMFCVAGLRELCELRLAVAAVAAAAAAAAAAAVVAVVRAASHSSSVMKLLRGGVEVGGRGRPRLLKDIKLTVRSAAAADAVVVEEEEVVRRQLALLPHSRDPFDSEASAAGVLREAPRPEERDCCGWAATLDSRAGAFRAEWPREKLIRLTEEAMLFPELATSRLFSRI